jgi:hypothetical protein
VDVTVLDVETDSPCHTAVEGESCFDDVMWAVTEGLDKYPDWYPGLSASSEFEEFQKVIHKKGKCPMPCDTHTPIVLDHDESDPDEAPPDDPPDDPPDCHTAVEHESCYDDVMWAMKDGLEENPDWYPGLDASSSMEAFQAAVHHNSPKKCPQPCSGHSPQEPKPQEPDRPTGFKFPALFCFCVARVNSYELDIVLAQRKEGIGIFECDDQRVLSQDSYDLGDGMWTVTFPGAKVGRSKDGFAANVDLFVNAWRAVYEDGGFKYCDIIIKVDPDAVLIPARLRPFLKDHVKGPLVFPNCGKFHSSDYPMMYGAMEVISKDALYGYIDHKNEDRCKNQLPWWPSWGEDLFMTKCLQTLGSQSVEIDQLLQDRRCWGVSCFNKQAAVFHDFKSVASWMECWGQTTGKR